MMESVKIRQYVGHDRILHLDIPVGVTRRDVDVMVIYQPVLSSMMERSLEQFYGICADDPIIIDGQGILESLDDELAGAFD